jgi:superfamily II DNA or RNA helicase
VCIGEVVSRVTAAELQDKGFLANCHVNIVQLQDHAEFKTYQQELAYLVGNDDRLDYLAKLITKIASEDNTLILVDRISTGQVLQAYIAEHLGVEVSFVSGSTKGTKRAEEYKSIASADGKVIIATYGVAAVGLNIPRIFNLVMLEPGKSFVRVIQSIGRGLRKAHDKDHVEIWDLTSSCKFSKRHLTQRKQFYAEAVYPFTIEKVQWK